MEEKNNNSQSEVITTQPSPQLPNSPQKLSHKKRSKLLLIVLVVFLLLIGFVSFRVYQAFTYHCCISVYPNITPTASVPTPTVNLTANWKTYTNSDYGFSLKYPLTWQSEEENMYNTRDINGKQYQFHIISFGEPFTPDQFITQKYFSPTDTPRTLRNVTIWFASNPDFQKIDLEQFALGQPLQAYKKITITVDSVSAEEVSYGCQSDCTDVLFRKGDTVFTVTTGPNSEKNLPEVLQILSTFKFTDQASGVDANGWKTYENNKFSISYPATMTLDNSFNGNALAVFLESSDYQMSGYGDPAKGFTIGLQIGQTGFSGPQGLKSTENTTWLGQPATLQVYQYEANDLVLTAKFHNVPYQISMTVASDAVRDANKNLFLQIANTLKIK